jgi:hypothetical protein
LLPQVRCLLAHLTGSNWHSVRPDRGSDLVGWIFSDLMV